MQTARTQFLLGATLLVAGFGVLTDGSPIRNSLVQTMVETIDMKERECRSASVALGSVCPAGCEAKPERDPSEREAPPTCHSRWWVATCGAECAPAADFARLPDGRLVDATRLLLVLEGEPDAELQSALSSARVTIEPRFDGLYRYTVRVPSGASLEKTKKRLAALPGVRSVEEIAR